MILNVPARSWPKQGWKYPYLFTSAAQR